MAGKLNLKQIASSGASVGQIPAWDGAAWSPTTSSGSARPALCFSKSYDPPPATYSGSTIHVLVQYGLAAGYQGLSPIWWKLPAATAAAGGQLNPGVRLYWSNSTTTDLFNTQTTAPMVGYRWQQRFNKDGLRITQIAFIAQNTATTGIYSNMTEFVFEGDQS